MIKQRRAHAVTNIGHHIYVVGGITRRYKELACCERYDILEDKWYLLENANLPMQLYSITLQPYDKRFIFAFGGTNDSLTDENSKM